MNKEKVEPAVSPSSIITFDKNADSERVEEWARILLRTDPTNKYEAEIGIRKLYATLAGGECYHPIPAEQQPERA